MRCRRGARGAGSALKFFRQHRLDKCAVRTRRIEDDLSVMRSLSHELDITKLPTARFLLPLGLRISFGFRPSEVLAFVLKMENSPLRQSARLTPVPEFGLFTVLLAGNNYVRCIRNRKQTVSR